jgi:serine/threonine-protein kinase RsbW
MSTSHLVDLVLAPQPELLRAVRLVISSVAADLGFSMEEMEDLKLAVQEACSTRIVLGLAHETLRVSVGQGGPNCLVVEVSGDQSGDGSPDEEAQWGLDLASALVDTWETRHDASGIQILSLSKAAAQSGRAT